MTLAETYAGASAVPLAEPDMVDAFYPLDHPIEKAVLIHAFAGATVQNGNQLHATFPAKIYQHFDEVIRLLKAPLEAAGYRLYQIGGPNEPGLPGIESLVGKTNLHQCAYLVRNCALLIGNDSLWAHVRGAAHGAQVHIYGSTSKPHFPYWCDPAKAVLIEAHRGGKRPSYAAVENPKTIDQIPPEEIANAALRLLMPKVEPTGAQLQVTRQSLFFGDACNQHVIELVPNVVVAPQVAVPGALVLRVDYGDGIVDLEDKILGNLQVRPCAIVTDRELNLNLLVQAKSRITGMRVELGGNISPAWIKAVRRLGLPVGFFSSEVDPEKLARQRLDLYDVCLFDHFRPPTRDDFLNAVKVYLNRELDSSIRLDTLNFRTNRLTLSEDKIYLSLAHWKAGQSVANSTLREGRVIDDPLFWNESLPHVYIYQ